MTRDDKKRVMRRKGGREERNLATWPSCVTMVRNVDTTGNKEVLQYALSRCKEVLEETSMYQNLRTMLLEEHQHLEQIVCYGIGNFAAHPTSYRPPLVQLACALLLRELVRTWCPSVLVVYYDPCTTAFEREFLDDHGFQVLTKNERGRRSVSVSTLFWMPHCPRPLYMNVLLTNWSSIGKRPNCVVILGNSWLEHETSSFMKPTPGMSPLVPWVDERPVYLLTGKKRDRGETPFDMCSAFSDTYLIRFRPQQEALPDRPKCRVEHSWDRDLGPDTELL